MTNIPKEEPGRRCLFLDRDGVINRSPGQGYVLSPSHFVLNEGIGELLQSFHSAGWLSIVITSQRCVGKDMIDLSMLASIHQSMQEELNDRYGCCFDAIYAFTGLPGTESWEKPNPGMIEQACNDHCIEPSISIMAGDQDRDIEMAQKAGIGSTVRVVYGAEHRSQGILADQTVFSISELVLTLKKQIMAP
ncbi:MAG: HAD-IIIA family hydrolase [Verrucomicrobiales bacterium]|nr:HAD-IIIA family hydrolase [Verrucomicrobiales bacterium]